MYNEGHMKILKAKGNRFLQTKPVLDVPKEVTPLFGKTSYDAIYSKGTHILLYL